ncbi:MAG: hypothetical protein MUO68_18155 [Desulfobacteraceae bacterium]|nr:hypothetical protein [Desulfobacteraceae bacterium]
MTRAETEASAAKTTDEDGGGSMPSSKQFADERKEVSSDETWGSFERIPGIGKASLRVERERRSIALCPRNAYPTKAHLIAFDHIDVNPLGTRKPE